MKPYYQDDAVTIYHGDCREIVPTLGRFDLLLTDPPYGLGEKSNGGSWGNFGAWDADAPDVLPLLATASKSIIWGGNYFPLPPSRCWMVWDKPEKMPSVADCELAWCSWDANAKLFRIGRHPDGRRSHPTQKPLALMSWCITLAGDVHTILDPFAGSCTTGRAAKDLGRKAVLIEREERYCEIGAKRMQQEVFDFKDSTQNPLDTPPPHLASVGYPEKSNGAGDPDFDLAPPFGPHIPHPVTAEEAGL